jgi:hypothetical protein
MARRVFAGVVLAGVLLVAGMAWAPGMSTELATGPVVVLGYNDLGMHCMNEDFSQFMILPPYNTLHAQVIDRSSLYGRVLTSGVTVDYTIPGNTRSSNKTNFWRYAPDLFGVTLPRDIGLTGSGLWGTMTATANGDWSVTGIPITPLTDALVEDAYQLATITVYRDAAQVAQTQAVVPVSWEISCNLCHGVTEDDPLTIHDEEQGTDLVHSQPVLCAQCHAQAPLGAPGQVGVPSLSQAMHSFHADEMTPILPQVGGVECYACHPGIRTQCLRDVHYSAGMTCTDCHGSMQAVGSSGRQPWVSEPRCSQCHQQPGSQYEQVNTLYRDSRGHGGLQCEACHGSPHATTPTVKTNDNLQAIAVQGHSGTIDVCTVCHATQPTGPFAHRYLFPDLTPGFWARDQILACYSAGIVTGFADNTYRPALAVTRDAMAVYIARALAGGDANVPPGPATPDFSDVPSSHWAYKYVEYCYAQRIVAGYGGGQYRPTLTVDRGQMAVFVSRAMVPFAERPGLPSYTAPSIPDFSDVPTTHWAYREIEYAKEHGVVAGYGDGTYRPDWLCTRDQMAVFVARAFGLPT